MSRAETVDSPTMEKMASFAPNIAPFTLPTMHGPVHVGQVSDLVVVALPDDAALGQHRVAVVQYDRPGRGGGVGMLSSLTPDEARGVAAALLRVANNISPVNPS